MINNASKVSAEKPLEGALLCCTSILPEDRAQLAEYAQEMGAKHTLDLTSDVTHLLVGNTDSKKYQYVAKEREDVKVLIPDWVHAVRKRWMADEPIDLNALDAEYRCPTLYGLKICITGFEDLDFRNELAHNIAKNGGQYTGDLTKDVTHLIAFIPTGKKYEYAGAWGVKIVSLKWYKDTLDRGMQLNESLYDPTIPPELQGRDAWNRQSPGSTRLGKRSRDDEPVQEPSRKLRRAASARFGSQQHDMWNDIVGQPQSRNLDAGAQKLRPTKSMSNMQQEPTAHPKPHPGVTPPLQAQQPATILDAGAQNHQIGFLAGKHFAQRGFDDPRRTLLFKALTGQGATVHQSVSDLLEEAKPADQTHFLIVPHDIESRQLAVVQNGSRGTAIVTELWLEYCMTVKAFVLPNKYALAVPICPTDIPGISRLVINASGFHQIQTMHIAKIVKKLGAIYCENFTQETSVLITNSGNMNEQKILHAASWKVPVVTEKWLWKLIATNRVPSFELFGIGALKQDVPPRHTKQAQSDASEEQQFRQKSVGNRAGDSENEDSFIEAAKAIHAQEKLNSLRQQQMLRGSDREQPTRKTELNTPPSDSRRSSFPLKEVSANIMSRASRSPKKKLFRQFDGNSDNHVEATEITADGDRMSGPRARVASLPVHDNEEDTPLICDDQELIGAGAQSNLTSAEIKASDGNLIKEFFEVKAAAEARKALASSNESKGKKSKLLGRALSNLSNSSRKSTEDGSSHMDSGRSKQQLSRASSINSVNTDGLGVPLSALSRIPSDLVANNPAQLRHQQNRSLAGNANAHLTRAATDSVLDRPGMLTNYDDSDASFHAALATLSTSQLPHPPSPTQQAQLTYADTDEAAKFKAHLAEKRRARARQGQAEADSAPEMSREEQERRKAELAREESNEKRQAKWRSEKEKGAIIKDDEKVVGVGRRTRGREKRLSALGGAEFGDAAGDGFLEGL